MMMRTLIRLFAVCLPGAWPLHASAAPVKSYDVVVYGGTAAGTIAAIAAASEGASVVLLEPGRHVGGMLTGGLGWTDHGRREVIGGLSREFFVRAGKHYGVDIEWYFEPHVAEKILTDWLAEAGVPVQFGRRLDKVRMDGKRIASIVTEDESTFRAKVFLDASYEGDLMARAGVSYTIGRESATHYGESLAGRREHSRYHQFPVKISPRYDDGNLMYFVRPDDPNPPGAGDGKVQAYNFRLCLTKRKDNQTPYPRPANYDPRRYDLLARYLQRVPDLMFKDVVSIRPVRNDKTDINNNGPFSTDHIGASWDYPDADYATRRRIRQDHVDYVQGFFYFLAHDPQVPAALQHDVNQWGPAKDEFVDTDHWPHQLYIREGRRMIGAYVMVQADLQTRRTQADSIGMGSYNSDSHHVQRIATADGGVINEGDMQVPVRAYEMPYRVLTPKASECGNLLVPACFSASHVAYSSMRMEPQYMILGQTAGVAAAMAVRGGNAVQKIDVDALRAKLSAAGQVLSWVNPGEIDSSTLPGIVLDDREAKLTGQWFRSRSVHGYLDDGYLHDKNVGKGMESARFVLEIPVAGRYEVRVAYTPYPNRATNVPVTIRHAQGTSTVHLNQQKTPPKSHAPFSAVGVYEFKAGTDGVIEISNQGADGHVVIDGIQLIRRP
jgi:hypothetical protein